MARNQQKHQKRLAKKKKKRKVKKAKSTFASSPMGQTKQASTMPIYECLVPKELEENGIGHIFFSRKMPDGNIALSSFLLDIHCLGVKDAFFKVCSSFEYEDFLQKAQMQETLEPTEPACARKLVEDSIEYARNIGFEPHKDYKLAGKIFGNVETESCTKTFIFGKDGKPFYISGPFDSPQKIDRIVKTLDKTCGKDNYEILIALNDPDDAMFFD